MRETVGAGKGKPSAGDGEGRRGPDTQSLHEGGVPGRRWRSSQHELLQQLLLRPGREATGPSAAGREWRGWQGCCNLNDLGVLSAWKTKREDGSQQKWVMFFNPSDITSLLPV